MSMKVLRLYTHCSPADAHAIIELLDLLRDQLWGAYGDQIINHLQDVDERPTELELDDNIEF